MPDDGPTYLYRFFNENRQLLYVGVTKSAMARTATHQSGSPWFPETKHVEFETFQTRHEALAAEQAAIRAENPVYNVKYTPKARTATEPRVMLSIKIPVALMARLRNRPAGLGLYDISVTQVVERGIDLALAELDAKAEGTDQ